MNNKKTVAERYKEQGLIQFSCWIHPETMQKIKLLAQIQGLKIPELIEQQFKSIQLERRVTKNSVVVKFSRATEEEQETPLS